MNRPKSHHYVPRWYLERFIENETGYLYAYDTRDKSYRKQKPKELMIINQYYQQNWAPKGIDPNIFEKFLGSKLEPDAQRAFDRILAHSTDITAEETASILTYLEFQRIRVPRQAEMAKELLRNFLLLSFPPDVTSRIIAGKERIKIKESFRFKFMRTLIGCLLPYFGRMEWEIVEAPQGSSFVTSDSPVSFFNVSFPPPSEAGLGLAGTIVLFPLSSQFLLILRHPEYIGPNKVSPLTKISEPHTPDGNIPITYGTIWTKDQVNQNNRAMLQLLDRILVGNSKEVLEKCVDFY